MTSPRVRPVRTLLVSENFPPSIGGTSRWFSDLYSRAPSGAAVVAAGAPAGAQAISSGAGPPVVRIPLSFDEIGILHRSARSDFQTAYQSLRELVHTHAIGRIHAGRLLPEGWLAAVCRRRLRLPFACSVHGEELGTALTSRQLTWMTRRVLRHADLVIAISDHTAELLRGQWRVPADRIVVQRPVVDSRRFRPAPRDPAVRARLGWGDRPVILTAGRLQQRKGHDVLVEALARVRQAVPAVLWAVVGDGGERQRLEEAIARHRLGGHVVLHGAADDEILLAAYQQCDLFALPARDVGGDIEGFGIVYLEAQACGRPVVAGRSGGTSEALDDGMTGQLVDAQRPEPLAATLVELLLDSERLAAMGRLARDWVVARFDAATGAARFFGLLDERLPAATS